MRSFLILIMTFIDHSSALCHPGSLYFCDLMSDTSLVTCVEDNVTLGKICNTLRDAFGESQPAVGI